MENDNDPTWKWGLFYFNKEDKRIFPPKRYGIGWTVNFANPKSILALIIMLSFFGFIAFMIETHQK
jgi:uncharacterized membrane protein